MTPFAEAVDEKLPPRRVREKVLEATPYGKLVRIHRIDQGITLNDMAKTLEISPAFLSSIETGRKSIPVGIMEKTIGFFELDTKQEAELREAADISKREFKIKMPVGTGSDDREIAAMFARQFPKMSQEQKDRLKQLLEGRRA